MRGGGCECEPEDGFTDYTVNNTPIVIRLRLSLFAFAGLLCRRRLALRQLNAREAVPLAAEHRRSGLRHGVGVLRRTRLHARGGFRAEELGETRLESVMYP